MQISFNSQHFVYQLSSYEESVSPLLGLSLFSWSRASERASERKRTRFVHKNPNSVHTQIFAFHFVRRMCLAYVEAIVLQCTRSEALTVAHLTNKFADGAPVHTRAPSICCTLRISAAHQMALSLCLCTVCVCALISGLMVCWLCCCAGAGAQHRVKTMQILIQNKIKKSDGCGRCGHTPFNADFV